MRVNQAQIKRREKQIRIRDRDENRPVDARVALVRREVGLYRAARAARHVTHITRATGVAAAQAAAHHVRERRVRHVQLRHPDDERGGAGAGARDVAPVWAEGGVRRVPVQQNRAAWVRERDGAVARDGGPALNSGRVHGRGAVGGRVAVCGRVAALRRRDGGVIRGIEPGAQRLVVGGGAVGAERVGLADHAQRGEVLPGEAGLVTRARGDVRAQQRPGPGLRDAHLEPLGHGEQAQELAEDDVLARGDGHGAEEHGGGCARVEVRQHAVDARFVGSGELLGEVEPFADVGEVGVVVVALLGRGAAEDVGKHRCAADCLPAHESNEIAVFGSEVCHLEVRLREAG